LNGREAGLLKADTDQQAQVALLDLVQNTARVNQVEIRGSQEFREKVLDDDYGEVSVTVAFTCGMEQLVNLLAAIGNQPEILATNEIHISGGNDKNKNVQVRMVVSAAVPASSFRRRKAWPHFETQVADPRRGADRRRDLCRRARARPVAGVQGARECRSEPAGGPGRRAPIAGLASGPAGAARGLCGHRAEMLLDKSRNSTVVIETPPAPPPVPCRPAVLSRADAAAGGRPLVILSAKAGAEHQGIHPGEMIGPSSWWKPPARISFFNGGPAHPEETGRFARPWRRQRCRGRGKRQAGRRAAAKSQAGPGTSLTSEVKACVANDSYEDGAVVDGFRRP